MNDEDVFCAIIIAAGCMVFVLIWLGYIVGVW